MDLEVPRSSRGSCTIASEELSEGNNDGREGQNCSSDVIDSRSRRLACEELARFGSGNGIAR